MNPSDAGCPICLRGRSKYEITRDYARLRADKSRRRRLPFVVLGGLMAAGAVVSTVYNHREKIADACDVVRARLTRFADEAGDPANYATHPPAQNDEPPQVAAPGPAEVAPPAPSRAAATPVSAPARAAPKNIPDLAAPPMNPEMWAVYGRVYDLKTLKPAGNVPLEFVHSTGGRHGGSSDADGRYLVALKRSDSPGGYEAVCSDPRYLPSVFHEADIPYAALSSADREVLIDSARSGDTHSTPLVDIAGTESLRLDLFLAPRR